MTMQHNPIYRAAAGCARACAALAVCALAFAGAAWAQSGEPIKIGFSMALTGLLGLAVNSEFNYPNYFVMIPSGPDAKPAFTKGFFDIAMAQNPKPQTVAIVAADQEFSRNAADGARENAQKAKLKIVYDKTYPPSSTDFAPIVRAT